MVPWWLPVDLPNISANTDRFETWLVSIERSFQGLSVAVKTVRIVKELVEIWLNEVCDRENLKNTKEAIKEFEKEYQRDMKDVARQKHEKGIFRRGELPGRFIARKLFRWSDKRYNQEYWERLESNWRWWKGGQTSKRRNLETVKEEEEEIDQENSGVREWTKENEDKMDNMVDLYYEL